MCRFRLRVTKAASTARHSRHRLLQRVPGSQKSQTAKQSFALRRPPRPTCCRPGAHDGRPRASLRCWQASARRTACDATSPRAARHRGRASMLLAGCGGCGRKPWQPWAAEAEQELGTARRGLGSHARPAPWQPAAVAPAVRTKRVAGLGPRRQAQDCPPPGQAQWAKPIGEVHRKVPRTDQQCVCHALPASLGQGSCKGKERGESRRADRSSQRVTLST